MRTNNKKMQRADSIVHKNDVYSSKAAFNRLLIVCATQKSFCPS